MGVAARSDEDITSTGLGPSAMGLRIYVGSTSLRFRTSLGALFWLTNEIAYARNRHVCYGVSYIVLGFCYSCVVYITERMHVENSNLIRSFLLCFS